MRRQDKAKNMKRVNMLFEQRNNKSILKEDIQFDFWDLQGKPMFGGYYYDVKFNRAMYIIFISAEPTKDAVENHDLRKLTYYVAADEWDYGKLEVAPDENDKKILAFMEEKIKQDAPVQQAHDEKRKAEKEKAEEKARRYQR